MATITKEIRVDVARRNNFVLVAKQNDIGSRFLKVTLCNEGYSIRIPDNSSVVMNAERPDKTSAAFAGSVNPDGTVNVPITGWMLALNGMVRCSVSVITGDRRLTSTAFALGVEPAEFTGEGITEDENYDLLIRLIEDCTEAKQGCETATRNANAATSAANAAAESANRAAAAANQSKTDADTASANANTAAKVAEQAADAANTAKSNADTAAENANLAAASANAAAALAEAAADADGILIKDEDDTTYLAKIRLNGGKPVIEYTEL